MLSFSYQVRFFCRWNEALKNFNADDVKTVFNSLMRWEEALRDHCQPFVY